jgi:hypothetical protein
MLYILNKTFCPITFVLDYFKYKWSTLFWHWNLWRYILVFLWTVNRTEAPDQIIVHTYICSCMLWAWQYKSTWLVVYDYTSGPTFWLPIYRHIPINSGTHGICQLKGMDQYSVVQNWWLILGPTPAQIADLICMPPHMA